ncbi:MAG: hypothetical protein KC505_08630 [Myxococcales bacterium]|nr:hypothetical protein [Myxococcales bacterium]USN51634.1 MAG: hypothetical protein H6731_04280 [Myxococcales bacterium]
MANILRSFTPQKKLLQAKLLDTINKAVMKGQKGVLDNLLSPGGAGWNALEAIDD